MILNNYYLWRTNLRQLIVANSQNFAKDFINVNNEPLTVYYNPYNQTKDNTDAKLDDYDYCVIGSSDDPEQIDDYCLHNKIESCVTNRPISEIIINETTESVVNIIVSGYVTEAATIKEVGVIKQFYQRTVKDEYPD